MISADNGMPQEGKSRKGPRGSPLFARAKTGVRGQASKSVLASTMDCADCWGAKGGMQCWLFTLRYQCESRVGHFCCRHLPAPMKLCSQA